MYDLAKSFLMENVFNNYKKAASSSALNTKDGNVLLQKFCEDLCEVAKSIGLSKVGRLLHIKSLPIS